MTKKRPFGRVGGLEFRARRPGRGGRGKALSMRLLPVLGAVSLLAVLLAPRVFAAQDLPAQEDSLRALSSLAVDVQLVGASERIGIDAGEVRGAVEARLREAGIAVPAKGETPRGDPTLQVTLHAIDATGGYAFMVSVQFLEWMVSLRRYVELVLLGALTTSPADSIEPLDLMPSVRWQARAVGTTGAARARTFLPESVLGYVDRFLDDYRAANQM